MSDVLIEQNSSHVDDEDMAALIAAVHDLGYVAAPTDEGTLYKAAWWVLGLRWVGDDTLHVGFGAGLTALAGTVRRHYLARHREPPRRIHLYGSDGRSVLASVDVEEDDERHGPLG